MNIILFLYVKVCISVFQTIFDHAYAENPAELAKQISLFSELLEKRYLFIWIF